MSSLRFCCVCGLPATVALLPAPGGDLWAYCAAHAHEAKVEHPYSRALVIDRRALEPRLGMRVELVHDIDRFPHFVAPAGSHGTVSDVEEGLVAVRLDRPLAGAEDWDNAVQWYEEQVDLFAVDVRVLDDGSPSQVSAFALCDFLRTHGFPTARVETETGGGTHTVYATERVLVGPFPGPDPTGIADLLVGIDGEDPPAQTFVPARTLQGLVELVAAHVRADELCAPEPEPSLAAVADPGPRGAWLTRPYDVELSDGSKRNIYAASQAQAEEHMERHLRRMGDARVVRPAAEAPPPPHVEVSTDEAIARAVHSLLDVVESLCAGLSGGEPVTRDWAAVVEETFAKHRDELRTGVDQFGELGD